MNNEQEFSYHFSAKFKNSECMQFLESFVNKYNKIISLIRYSKQSYNTKIQGTEIDHEELRDDSDSIKKQCTEIIK